MLTKYQAQMEVSEATEAPDDLDVAQMFWMGVPKIMTFFRDLARAALFSAQATSVPAEVAFSSSGFNKSKFRNNVSSVILKFMTVLRCNIPKDMVLNFVEEFVERTIANTLDLTATDDSGDQSDSDDDLQLLEPAEDDGSEGDAAELVEVDL
jgi:hypothetical protein